jgi:hypothetical protein
MPDKEAKDKKEEATPIHDKIVKEVEKKNKDKESK